MDNDANPMTIALSEYWGNENGWDAYKARFIRMSQAERVQQLKAADTMLDEYSTPSRELASMITCKREIQQLHDELNRLQK